MIKNEARRRELGKGMIKVKVCGIMNLRDLLLCQRTGVDVLGFVVQYPRPVPWNLTANQALPLISAANKMGVPSCIVTGGRPAQVIALAHKLRPSMVQLHHNESVVDTAEIAHTLLQSGIQTIRAIHDTSDSAALCQTDIAALLIDSRSPETAHHLQGNPCVEFYNQAKQHMLSLEITKPLILAGGIRPDNVTDLIAQTGADYIDVMTGVEDSPGVKCPDRLNRLMVAVCS